MSSRLLVVDAAATSRIVVKSALRQLTPDIAMVETEAAARASMLSRLPDIVVVDLHLPRDGALSLIRWMRGEPRCEGIPVIALAGDADPATRHGALLAGADEVLLRPLNVELVHARARSLLRVPFEAGTPALCDEAGGALGFREIGVDFARRGRVTLLGETGTLPETLHRHLGDGPPVRIIARPGDWTPDATRKTDVVLIALSETPTPESTGQLFRSICDLRARRETAYCPILVAVPGEVPELAAMALDLGADDVVSTAHGMAELGLRMRRLIRRKVRQDVMRATLRTSLVAAVTDPLTGLHNRRYALDALERMLADALRDGTTCAVMVLDLDHFKSVNDRFGHAAGDEVLAAVAGRLRAALGPDALLARIGGEEFLVALSDCDRAVAMATAERLRERVQRDRVATRHAAEPLTVTLSVGLAIGPSTETRPEDLIRAADLALLTAKTTGRNNVTCAASTAA